MTMQTLVGIFIFVSRETFILSCVENEQRFITSEPGRVRRKFHMGVSGLVQLKRPPPLGILARSGPGR